jgi:hypothetical protein
MGLGGLWHRIAGTGINIAEARNVIKEGLQEALFVMANLVANPGQETVYTDYVVPEFKSNAQSNIDDGWEDVDIGEYMDFMGEIVNEGNQIMAAAYEIAQAILSELEEAIEAQANEE